MLRSISQNIVKSILLDPICKGANRLCIVSSHATPSMVSWLLKTYEENGITNISIELIVESTIDNGIDNVSHEGFKELHGKHYSEFSGIFRCSYLYQPPPSKKNFYIWLDCETPLQAFLCSSDFTQTSLLKQRKVSIVNRSATYIYKLYKQIANRSIYCNHSEIEDYLIIHPLHFNPSYNKMQNNNHVALSLLTRTGEPGKKSGLNWGQRNKRNKNEAYIPLPSRIAKSGFFPLEKQHFLVVTDDHHTLQFRVEQQNDKAITTPASNALLGEYFRNRLGVANGAYIHAKDLRAYGRTSVSFYKIDEEQYYMDFSPMCEEVML